MNSLQYSALIIWIVVLVLYVVSVIFRRKTYIKMVEEIFSLVVFVVFLLSSLLSLTAILWLIFKDTGDTADVAMLLYVIFALLWPILLLIHWFMMPVGTTEEPENALDDESKEDMIKRHLLLIAAQALVLFLAFVSAVVVTASVWDDSGVFLRVITIIWVLQAAYDATLWNAQYFVWVRGRVAKDDETVVSLIRGFLDRQDDSPDMLPDNP